MRTWQLGLVTGLSGLLMTPVALADTISPASYTDTLTVGESRTIRKVVTVAERPAASVIDIMFVFDLTGSMGDEITDAKSAADAILADLATFASGPGGSLQSGSGWYSDTPPAPGFNGVHVDLNSGNTGETSGIADMWRGWSPGDPIGAAPSCAVDGVFVGCGGDTPELGYAGISDAADNASWRPGSNRFIVALGDASFKTPPTEAATIASLAAADAELIGIDYDFGTGFSTDITDLGGTVFDGGTSPSDVADAIIDAITASFATYSTVTVDDLGGGLPGVDVAVECVSTDPGVGAPPAVCVGDTAIGEFDRSVARDFVFDVTFTGLEKGTWDFPTFAIVDRGIVATERDSITVVPEPASLLLLGGGLLGVAGFARRRKNV